MNGEPHGPHAPLDHFRGSRSIVGAPLLLNGPLGSPFQNLARPAHRDDAGFVIRVSIPSAIPGAQWIDRRGRWSSFWRP